MTANVINQVPYLRTSRNFPEDLKQLTVEVNKAYIDSANAINSRTIGIFPSGNPAINGEAWFLTGNQKQQAFRQVYQFSSTANINIGFKFSAISRFVRCWGEYTDGTNWYGISHATSVAIAGQITFFLAPNGASTTSDIIQFVVGAGAPALNNGTIVLEWISKP